MKKQDEVSVAEEQGVQAIDDGIIIETSIDWFGGDMNS